MSNKTAGKDMLYDKNSDVNRQFKSDTYQLAAVKNEFEMNFYDENSNMNDEELIKLSLLDRSKIHRNSLTNFSFPDVEICSTS